MDPHAKYVNGNSRGSFLQDPEVMILNPSPSLKASFHRKEPELMVFMPSPSLNPSISRKRKLSQNKDPEVMVFMPSPSSKASVHPARKQNQNKVVPHDIIEIDEDEDPADVVIIGEKHASGSKSKSTMGYNKNWQKQIKDALAKDLMDSKAAKADPGLAAGTSLNLLKSFGPGSEDLSYFEKYYDDYSDLAGMVNNYEFSLDAQFAAVDLPPWVEAPIPWLEKPSNQKPSTRTSGASSSTVPMQPSSSKPCSSNQKEENEDEHLKKFQQFKRFDTVCDYSDHYYTKTHQSSSRNNFQGGSLIKKSSIAWSSGAGSTHVFPTPNPFGNNLYSTLPSSLLPPLQPLFSPPVPPPVSPPVPPPVFHSKQWTKKIQQEWKILEKDLPEAIFVRVYEERMDLLRAVIVGAAGTPYHDGLFFFDISFPSNYPSKPPLVYYHSGGLRLNPNLYACGKVCLSLLNTWHGSVNETWTPTKSTMLQVLVSIQALVLNAKPYFNEPGYASTVGTLTGEKRSLVYNEDTFLLSCKTMLYTLQRPPKHFEDFVKGHFRQRAQAILEACNAYKGGAQVGCLVGGGAQGGTSCSPKFKKSLGELLPKLVEAFAKNGAGCGSFSNRKW
ncbi:uncharacterized protein LOC143862509 [Tasmannia lanceolata]|uniref:uncharacterized protein LOC143862509 n=1 Tax=Tasmannia lanceolata TaxID=3420 RepID=UPI0040647E11